MSQAVANPLDGGASQNEAPKSRKAVAKKLSTGHRITLTPQDDRTLKVIYDFMSGFSKRKYIESAIESKKRDVELSLKEIPASARILMKQRAAGNVTGGFGFNNEDVEVDSTQHNNNDWNNFDATDEVSAAARSEAELLIDTYYREKEQLQKLEEKLKAHTQTDHRIGIKDLDAVIKSLGITMSKKHLEVCSAME